LVDALKENVIDIAVATMQQSVVTERGLVPAEIAHLEFKGDALSAEVIIVGFSMGRPHIHAVRAIAVRYERSVRLRRGDQVR